MSRFPRFAPLSLLALAVLISTAGCKSNANNQTATTDQPATDNSQPAATDTDAANANLAPVSNASTSAPAPSTSASAPSASGEQASGPAADSGSYTPVQEGEADYQNEQPTYTASEAPPPLPEYQQPPSPGDDYLWTPGYWSYAQTGYYWVPGVWVQAPYQGALWTPGYWRFDHGHYGYFRGYWGPHIGFYGGVDYGFGYTGAGYQGGYWNSGRFYYNRSVNNININIVHNVYNRTVIVNNVTRVSYNGGSGGLRVQPRPAELVALREPHAPPMQTQLANQQAASVNRAQFVAVNHGKPATLVVAKPLVADRDVHPVAPPPVRNMPAAAQRGGVEAHPGVTQPAHPATVAPGQPGHPAEPVRPETRSTPVQPHVNEPGHPATTQPGHPAEPVRPETRTVPGHPTEPARPNTTKPVHPNTPPAHTTEPAHPATHPATAHPETTHPETTTKPASHPEAHTTVEHPAPKKTPAEIQKEKEEHPQ